MTKKKKIQFPPENKIPKNHTFDMCMHLNSDKLHGYFTYLSYKEYKYDWIENFKANKGREPTSVELEDFKKNLLEKDYENFIKNAEDKVQKFFSKLVENEVKDRLTQEKRNSFGRSAFASAVGSFGLIVLFLALSWAFHTGLFDKVYALIVPNLSSVSK